MEKNRDIFNETTNPQINRIRQANLRKKRRRRRRIKKMIRRFLALVILFVICLGLIRSARVLASLGNSYKETDFLADLMQQVQENKKDSNDSELEILKDLKQLAKNNPEAEDFVQDYSNRALYLHNNIDLTKEVNGIGQGDGPKVPLLMQWDKRWGYENFGDSIIGLSGCGPTCLSMAYLYFTHDPSGTPLEMASFIEKQGYYTSAGTDWALWTEGIVQWGLTGKVLALDERIMKNAIDDGGLIICSMRPGDFTTSGHYILIWGYSEQGFLVNDSNKKSNSDVPWSYEVLSTQIKNLWVLNKS